MTFSQFLNKLLAWRNRLKVRSAGKDNAENVLGVLLDRERIKTITPPLKHSLEQMRILEGIDLEKEVEPTTFLFAVGRRASRQ